MIFDRAIHLIQNINELLDSNTFTHEDHEYSLTKLNALVKNKQVQDFNIDDLDWIFKYDDPEKDNPNRIKTAWLSLPILVTKWKNKLVVLDGLHRLKKAQNLGMNKIKGKIVTADDLKSVLIK